MFCRSLFVLLYIFFWPLCCLFFFDIRILITPLASSKSSYKKHELIILSEIYDSQWYFVGYRVVYLLCACVVVRVLKKPRTVSCAQCCTFLWIVHSSLPFRFALKFIYYIQFVLCLLCPRLHVSLDCPFLIATSVFSNIYLLPPVCPV